MTVIDEILAANTRYAGSFDKGELPMPPGRKVAIVTCMDARIETGRALELEEGDAHVIRNAGGRVSEALRSLAISQQLLGTEEVAIIHHTDCGMLTFTDEQLRQKLRENLGADASHIAFLPFSDVEQSVVDDLEAYAESHVVRHDIPVRGFVFDVKTGALREVRVPAGARR
ncbi:MAG TPA: carbonic anhydrase [Tepidiformaceae bacterium]|nr:carbonic anhydrase [Tepidiformaceae bacterium]